MKNLGWGWDVSWEYKRSVEAGVDERKKDVRKVPRILRKNGRKEVEQKWKKNGEGEDGGDVMTTGLRKLEEPILERMEMKKKEVEGYRMDVRRMERMEDMYPDGRGKN
jgi:hypothetical protein